MVDENNVMVDENNIMVDENVNILTNNQCIKCNKLISSKQYLKKHLTICKGKLHPLECYICNKILSNRSSKSNHIKMCKLKQLEENKNIIEQPTTIINNTNNNGYTQFIKDHITEKAIVDIISKSNNDLSLIVENFHRLLCINE
jgi:hypothetical protein